MILDSVLDANRSYAAGNREARAKTEGGPVGLIVCMSGKIQQHIPEALGLRAGEYYQIGVAGSSLSEGDRAVVRSVCLAAATGGVREFFVIGHTQCSSATDTMAVLNALEKAGVPRAALGTGDLRALLGLISTPQSGADATASALRSSPWIPPGTAIHALMMDSRTGKLEVVSRGAPERDVKKTAEGWAIGASIQVPSVSLPQVTVPAASSVPSGRPAPTPIRFIGETPRPAPPRPAAAAPQPAPAPAPSRDEDEAADDEGIQIIKIETRAPSRPPVRPPPLRR